MKNAVILFEKGEVLIRTRRVNTETVEWVEGEKKLSEILSSGYTIKDNGLIKVLSALENVRDRICWGQKPTSAELIDIIKLLREY